MEKLGLIAGGGRFPFLVAEEARSAGCRVFSVAFRDESADDLERVSDRVLWIRLGELDKLTHFFKQEGVDRAIMAGHVRKPKLWNGSVRPDLAMIKLISGLKNWKDATLLEALADYLEKQGIRLVDSTSYLPHALPKAGVVTKRRPSKTEYNNIAFGFRMAKQIAALDIGQTVIVKDRSVVAVESAEGTDETIRRGGRLASENAVAVKVARPRQDMRFDVPAIGLETIRTAIDVRIRVLAIEADKTLFFEREQAIQLANEHKISIVAVSETEMEKDSGQ